MNLTSIGQTLIIAGAVLVFVGGLIWAVGKAGLPLGNLPGDINVQRENLSFHFPILTCILISIALTIALNAIGRFWR